MPFKNLFPHLYKVDGVDGAIPTPSVTKGAAAAPLKKLYGDFKLPISYTKTYPIPPSVASDLELVQITDSAAAGDVGSGSDTKAEEEKREPIYNFLLSPKHAFSRELVAEWAAAGFTDDVDFLRDTQKILRCATAAAGAEETESSAQEIVDIWHEVKDNGGEFLEKYGYMDWKILEPLNLSAPFLDFLSVYNILSPALSLLLPVFLLIVPFFILKVRGVPITFQLYCEILRDVAKYHILGKTFTQIASNMTIDKIAYLLVSIFLYVMQTYQNTVCCIRFFRNVRKMRDSLHKYRVFVGEQIDAMEHWSRIMRDAGVVSAAYVAFTADIDKHCVVLKRFLGELKDVEGSLLNGKMMRCFYLLHKDAEYEKALQYAMGFSGYLSHLDGIKENMVGGFVNCGEFIDAATIQKEAAAEEAEEAEEATENKEEDDPAPVLDLKQFYHPALKSRNPVKNDAAFKHNFIITGPNAAGKTTVLKATILNVIFTQQFGTGFYDSCSLVPYTHIHSYLNIPDTSARESLFQAETLRCKNIIDCIDGGAQQERHFCIFDELFSGTNPTESTKTAQAFLLYLSRRWPKVTFMMTTHYTDICEFMEARRATVGGGGGGSDAVTEEGAAEVAVANYQMRTEVVQNDGAAAAPEKIRYLYVIEPGISKVQGAVKVLRDMNYPEEILRECE